ncbi:MAG: hypothetical protein LBC74_10285, partial [Planctomycetaceae bacterium]|nr:hypothetical protein [Planctomycetaceae bacterium]
KTPPSEANNSHPSEGSGVVSYRLSKRSIIALIVVFLFLITGLLQIVIIRYKLGTPLIIYFVHERSRIK